MCCIQEISQGALCVCLIKHVARADNVERLERQVMSAMIAGQAANSTTLDKRPPFRRAIWYCLEILSLPALLQGLCKKMGKPRNGWIWPNDGKRRNTFDAFKDVITGKGPDIHIGRIDRGWGPQRSRWSRWTEHDPYAFFTDHSMPPARHADRHCKQYNFRTRKYEVWHPQMWSDVVRRRDSKDSYPERIRDAYGRWEATTSPRRLYHCPCFPE